MGSKAGSSAHAPPCGAFGIGKAAPADSGCRASQLPSFDSNLLLYAVCGLRRVQEKRRAAHRICPRDLLLRCTPCLVLPCIWACVTDIREAMGRRRREMRAHPGVYHYFTLVSDERDPLKPAPHRTGSGSCDVAQFSYREDRRSRSPLHVAPPCRIVHGMRQRARPRGKRE